MGGRRQGGGGIYIHSATSSRSRTPNQCTSEGDGLGNANNIDAKGCGTKLPGLCLSALALQFGTGLLQFLAGFPFQFLPQPVQALLLNRKGPLHSCMPGGPPNSAAKVSHMQTKISRQFFYFFSIFFFLFPFLSIPVF